MWATTLMVFKLIILGKKKAESKRSCLCKVLEHANKSMVIVNRPVVSWVRGRNRNKLQREMRKLFWVMKAVRISREYTYVKTYQSIYFKYVRFITLQLHHLYSW
jgi:hypothetical protein